MARWHTCNILYTAPGGRRLWQLSASGDNFVVQGEKALLLDENVPPGIAAKDWQTLFRHKLNIAWLPADRVFLRTVQVPAADPAETAQMIELQLEKLSPLPVTQIVWSFYLLPRTSEKTDGLQTVIVLIAGRAAVEEYLGQLEAGGYLADRLEAPGLDRLLATRLDREGVWIFPGATGEPVLVAWWYGGILQNVTLVALPDGPDRGPLLRTQIEQIAWTGELEGWLPGAPAIMVVATPPESTFWQSVFKEAGETVQIIPPVAPTQLAALTARRCAADSTSTNLLPQDFATRYHQRFVDGLWFRGLMAVGSAYVIGVLIYFGALTVLQMRYTRVQHDLHNLGASYTNALKDVAQIQMLTQQQQLKYAALDCWSVVAQRLPDSMTINNLYFDRSKLELNGVVTADDVDAVGKFNEDLRRAVNPQKPEQLLFTDVSPPTTRIHGDQADWRFSCSLAQSK